MPFNISFTFFNPSETEYTGSLKSAKHLFGEKNIVLLPDTYLRLKESDDIIDLVNNSLNETGFTFFFNMENAGGSTGDRVIIRSYREFFDSEVENDFGDTVIQQEPAVFQNNSQTNKHIA